MKPSAVLACLAVAAQPIHSAAINDALSDISVSVPQPVVERDDAHFEDLVKRKGGGGGGGRGGSSGGSSGGSRGGSSGSSGSRGGSSSSGSSGSSGSSSGSSGSRGGSSSSSGSSSGGRTGLGSSSSGTGGRTTTGSGPRPAYGGGSAYSGGAAAPYRAGATRGSIVPYALGGAALGGAAALAFWPGIWYHPIYYYPYHNYHNYHNQSSGKNETKPVACACDETVECSCEENENTTAIVNELIGNGSINAMNSSVVALGNVNGTDTILINGTLPNGTTAAGGTESPDGDDDGGDGTNGSESLRILLQHAGYWPVLATVCATVFLL